MSAALALELAPLSEKPRLGKKVAKPRLVWENPALSAGKHKGNSKVKGRSSYGRVLYMNARVYDASIGRFMSADTIVPDPFHSQDFNRYSYVRNNPLKYTDPTGRQLCGTEGVEDNNFTFGLCIQDFYDYRDIGYDPRDELSGGPNGPGAPPNNGDPTLPAPDPVAGDGNIAAPPSNTPPVFRPRTVHIPNTGRGFNADGTLAGVVEIINSDVGIFVTNLLPGVELGRAIYYDEGAVAIIAGVCRIRAGWQACGYWW